MGMIKSLAKINKANGIGETIKFGVGMVVGISVDLALTALLKGHIPPGKGVTRWLIKLGIFGMAMKAGEDVENYFYKVVDDTKEAFNEAKEETRKALNEAAEEEAAAQ
jgi:hypothetical protein